MRALRPAPRPTFSRRESRQRYARDLLVPGPPAKGALPPLIPWPSALAVLVAGKKARGILGVRNLPRHGLKTQSVPLMKPKEKQDRFAHQLKVANRSIFVAEGSPARCVSEREKGGDHAPGDSKGHSPWRAFGDFPRDGKVTRVQGGAPASGTAGAPRPA